MFLDPPAYMLQEQEPHVAEMERTFMAIKPDGVQRGLISEIVGFKLVAIKLIVPSKDFAQKHYHDLKERPFFNGLCDFLGGPVLAMVKDEQVSSPYKLYKMRN
ncbi:hypothetical protein MKW92_033487 [Papaver armeniacum]|nr:hypothetical protein MKW92_033487 [Papaver armeniacum]